MSAERFREHLAGRPFSLCVLPGSAVDGEALGESQTGPKKKPQTRGSASVPAAPSRSSIRSQPSPKGRVSEASPGSWADSTGLQPGEFILKVNSEDLETMSAERFREHLAGRPVQLHVRSGFVTCGEALDVEQQPIPKTKRSNSDLVACREIVAEEDVEKLGLHLIGNPPGNVQVLKALPNRWAKTNGLQPGDIILEANGEDLETMSAERFREHLAGRPLRLYIRPVPDNKPHHKVLHAKRLLLRAVADEGVRLLGLDMSQCMSGYVEVVNVHPGSWAETAGIKPGDVIWKLNGKDLAKMTGATFKQHMKERPLCLYMKRGFTGVRRMKIAGRSRPRVPSGCWSVDGENQVIRRVDVQPDGCDADASQALRPDAEPNPPCP